MLQKYLLVLILVFPDIISAQLQDLKGIVIANGEVEGIHVLNKSSLKYTVTDTDGTFIIPVKSKDTLVFSALKYNFKEIVVSSSLISENNLRVNLSEKINELDEVVIGKILTGNLGSDLKNTEVETPINFYDLGIPGYTGKQKTLSERKLSEATTGGGIIPFAPLINLISGRTKMLKERIKLERDIKCVQRLESDYKAVIFESENFSETQINRYFNSIIDSENLQKACYAKNELLVIEFLNEELKIFKARQTGND